MTVIKCGTKAKFCGIEGIICAIEINFDNVSYKFGYMDHERNYKTVWCNKNELELVAVQRLRIGFSTTKT